MRPTAPCDLGSHRTGRASHGGQSISRLEDLMGERLLLPPLPEQRKIAAILSSVDDAIAATRKVIEQTERVKQGLLQTLMTRGIGHTRFKQTEIGEIPEEWEVVTLEDVCEVRTGDLRSR
ncbi:MAG: restriction endonuclease subunit S [Gemmatimonadota bacterium]|nr:restriction endonuclease subunit S [Gemmatimonadota bacterium]